MQISAPLYIPSTAYNCSGVLHALLQRVPSALLSLSLCVCLYEVIRCILLFCMPGVSGMPCVTVLQAVLLNSRTTFKCCCTILAYTKWQVYNYWIYITNKQTNMILLPSIHCTFQDSVFSWSNRITRRSLQIHLTTEWVHILCTLQYLIHCRHSNICPAYPFPLPTNCSALLCCIVLPIKMSLLRLPLWLCMLA